MEDGLLILLAEFPGSKPVSEAATKYGPAYVSGPVTFILDKVSGLLPAEEAAAIPEADSSSKEATAEVIEEIKKEEAEKVEETPPPATENPPPAPAPEQEPETAPEPAKA